MTEKWRIEDVVIRAFAELVGVGEMSILFLFHKQKWGVQLIAPSWAVSFIFCSSHSNRMVMISDPQWSPYSYSERFIPRARKNGGNSWWHCENSEVADSQWTKEVLVVADVVVTAIDRGDQQYLVGGFLIILSRLLWNASLWFCWRIFWEWLIGPIS